MSLRALAILFCLQSAACCAGSANFSFNGITYISYDSQEYLSPDSKASIADLGNTGANWSALISTWYMDTPNSTAIAPDSVKTPLDAGVQTAIGDLHARGLKVMLKPQVDVQDGTWRGQIAPSDIAAWFTSYRAFITGYASMAQAAGVEMFCVGTELKTLSGAANLAEWTTTIAAIRSVYSGPLVYAANANVEGDEYSTVAFWNLLDMAGVDVYTPLTNSSSPSVSDLVAAWRHDSQNEDYVQILRDWQATVGRPVIFTEIGYQSAQGANITPNADPSTVPDQQAQADCYEAAFEVWSQEPWLKGMFWWGWSVPVPAPGDTSFTPRDKKAASVLATWYLPRNGDNDGDGFPNWLEIDLGTSPTDANSTPFGGSPSGPHQILQIDDMAVKLDFAKKSRDSMRLRGTLPIPANLAIANQQIVLDAEGVVRTFSLNSRGFSRNGSDRVKLTRQGGGVQADQAARFTIKLKRGQFSAKLPAQDFGAESEIKDSKISVDVIVLFNFTLYEANVPLLYRASKGKWGRARMP